MDTIESLAFARKNQYAALIRDEGVLVVWADRVEQIIPFASKLETALIAYLWADEKDPHSQDAPTAPTTPGLGSSPFSRSTLSFVNANQSVMSLTPAVVDLTSSGENLDGIPETAEGAVEEDPVVTAVKASRKGRPVAFHGAFIAGCASAGAMLLMGLGVRKYRLGHTIPRLMSRPIAHQLRLHGRCGTFRAYCHLALYHPLGSFPMLGGHLLYRMFLPCFPNAALMG